MAEQINEQELIAYIAGKLKRTRKNKSVLKYEQDFINKAHKNAKGEVDIDSDDIADYVLSRPDIKLDELTVDNILDAEMDFLMEKELQAIWIDSIRTPSKTKAFKPQRAYETVLESGTFTISERNLQKLQFSC